MQAVEAEIVTIPRETPTVLSEWIANGYSESITKEQKKERGQFFTPFELAAFMASFACIKTELDRIRILDPGCGTLTLTCALLEKIVKLNPSINRIEVDAYDIDTSLGGLNKEIISSAVRWGREQGVEIKINFIAEDFILSNRKIFQMEGNFSDYDYVISNPPYFKIGKHDPRLQVFKDKLHGQQNIYGLFLLASINLLKEGGQLIYLIPRSFTSGLYFQSFREQFLAIATLEHIHIFDSRVEGFKKDNVLQENIILKASRTKSDISSPVSISHSNGMGDVKSDIRRQYQENSIIQDHGKFKIIHLPVNDLEEFAISVFGRWQNTLDCYGMKVSTGPVVPFRSKEFLAFEKRSRRKFMPLVWMHNCLKMKLDLSITKKDKQPWVLDNTKSNSKVLESKNYVLLRRFSSKDDEYKLVATPIFADELKYSRIGIENHMNYLHRPSGELGSTETLGLAVLYNSSLFEAYFRSFSGNTQISATELNKTPMPPLELIIEIGKEYQRLSLDGIEGIDEIVERVLNLNGVRKI
ncbi:MAG: Eco57I restriction-modification methylase domain-containing protein [Fulvivirga sp.]